jgi:hypothetical protein
MGVDKKDIGIMGISGWRVTQGEGVERWSNPEIKGMG